MIPSVASFISIDTVPGASETMFGEMVGACIASCIPSVNQPFEETRRFKWNVENFVHKTMNFSYYVGEGPLYWYRIDWYPSVCPSISCVEMAPTISYIAPNCPYEIIENCIILPPSCDCVVSTPGECISQTVEVWHMLATSVIHLCERINQECCHRKPPGYMRRVRQYMRPALCCDVERSGAGSDNYVDVDFLKCECGNLVDPCIAVIIYPCHINRCGIHGPAFGDGPVPEINVIKMAPDILGHKPLPIAQEQAVSAMPVAVEIVPPKDAQPVNRVINKFGPSIPEHIHCSHNLYETDVFKDFLKMNKIKFDSMDLFYDKGYNSWLGSKNFKDWKVHLEWGPLENSGYKINMLVDRIASKVRTRLSLVVKSDDFTSDKGVFGLKFNYDSSAGTTTSGLLQSKIVKDDIGLFKSGWKGNLILKG